MALENMGKLVKDLIVAQYSMRILHWQSNGDGFFTAHLNSDEYIDKLGDFIDQAQEMCAVYNIDPPTLQEALDGADDCLKIDPNTKYTKVEVFTKIKEMFDCLIVAYHKAMSDDILQAFKSDLETCQSYLTIESVYKAKRLID